MTYVEFFDKASVRNILTALMDLPDRVVIIGSSTKHINKYIERYQRLFAERFQAVEFVSRSVSRSNLQQAITQLEKILDEFGECVFDITGGDEILNMALGVLTVKRSDIKFHRITMENNTVHDCDRDGITIEKHLPELTVDENIRIYGGDIVPGEVTEPYTWYYDLNEDFLQSIQRMWTFFCTMKNSRPWSRQINVFEAMVNTGTWDEEGLTVEADMYDVESYLWERGAKYEKEPEVLEGLENAKCISNFDDTQPGKLKVTFKDLQVRRVLSRAGTLLEVKVFATMSQPDMGYTDILTGVSIDWDGLRQEDEDYIETENEVDVIAMRYAVPIFISCKIGYLTSDELYKLESVGRRFGGPYAKLVLIANAIPNNKFGESLRDRAKKMKIHLIERTQYMTEFELKDRLDNLWSIEV